MSAQEGSERGQNGDEGARGSSAAGGESVLANLPRTRPQRSTARRVAARRSASTAPNGAVQAAEQATAAPARPAKTAPKPRRRKAAASGAKVAARGAAGSTRRRATSAKTAPEPRRTRAREPVPRQGFESDGEGMRGPVQPPGGAELFVSAVEILGELTKSGVSSGERLVKDVLSRLSPS